jgi:hypothetical protein
MTATPTAGSKRLVIVGATGMVGGYALRYALDHPAVERATAIGRRTVGISHPKLKEVLHRDFSDCSPLAAPLSGQDAAVFCLGTYTGSVPDAQLRTITVDYAIEFARVLRGSSPEAGFSFLSGGGADPYIYPVEARREPNFSYRLLRAIYPAFRTLFPNQVIRVDDLARAMVDVAVRGTSERHSLVFENRDIRALAESSRPR